MLHTTLFYIERLNSVMIGKSIISSYDAQGEIKLQEEVVLGQVARFKGKRFQILSATSQAVSCGETLNLDRLSF